MRRTGHRSQGKAVEKTALPPFEPLSEYLEQRNEALTHGDGALIRTTNASQDFDLQHITKL